MRTMRKDVVGILVPIAFFAIAIACLITVGIIRYRESAYPVVATAAVAFLSWACYRIKDAVSGRASGKGERSDER